MKNLFTRVLLGVFLTLGAFTSQAQQRLVWYNFNGFGSTSPTAPATQVASGVTASDFSATGLTMAAAGNVFNASAWPLTASADAGKYFSFTLTPSSTVSLDSLNWRERRSNTGPRRVAVRSSLDGFTADILEDSTRTQPTNTSYTLRRLALPAAFQNQSSAVEFRIYGYGATATGGTYRWDSVSVIGSVNAANALPTLSSFSFAGLSPAVVATINEADSTVAATVPFGTAVTALVPTIAATGGATINPASGVAQDFSSPVVYTLTGSNGRVRRYTVRVTVANQPVVTAGRLAWYNFNGFGSTSPSAPATQVATDVTASNFTATGVTMTAAGNTFNASNWSLTAALDAGKYFSFTLTPASGKSLNLDSLNWNERRSANSGPRRVAIRSSLDNFSSDLFADSTRAPGSGANFYFLRRFALPAAFQNQSNPVEFRVYGYGATAAAGTYRWDSVSVIGSVSTATTTPERRITAFAFNGLTPAVSATINEADSSIRATVPFGTSVTALVPTITLSAGATVSPNTGVAQDFTSPVTYIVTGSDNRTRRYTVTVTVASQPVVTGQRLVWYDFTGFANDTTFAPVTQVASGVQASLFRRVGLFRGTGSNYFNTSGWPQSASGDPLKYMTFTVRPAVGNVVRLDSLRFMHRRSGTGPTAAFIRSSRDNFASDIATFTLPTANVNIQNRVALPASFQAITDSVQFRIYAYSASGAGGTYRWDSVALSGTVQSLPGQRFITAFAFNGLTPAVTATINESDSSIRATVPFGTSITALVPTIAISAGASVSPNTGVAQDFTSPVTYIVTGSDNRTRRYTVTVTVAPAPPTGNQLYRTISQIRGVNAQGVADSLNRTVVITGTIYGSNLFTTASNPNGRQYVVIDYTQGVQVRYAQTIALTTNFQEGDSVRVRGRVEQFRGLIQVNVDSITLIASGRALKAPRVVTTLGEAEESDYIRINGLTLTSGWTTGTGNGGFTAVATDGTTNFDIRIVSSTPLYNLPAPTGTFDLIGVGSQFNVPNSAPFTNGYQVTPFFTNQIITGLSDAERTSFRLYPNPARGRMVVADSQSGERSLRLYNAAGQVALSTSLSGSEAEVSLAGLVPGLYLAELVNAQGQRRQVRLVVE